MIVGHDDPCTIYTMGNAAVFEPGVACLPVQANSVTRCRSSGAWYSDVLKPSWDVAAA